MAICFHSSTGPTVLRSREPAASHELQSSVSRLALAIYTAHYESQPVDPSFADGSTETLLDALSQLLELYHFDNDPCWTDAITWLTRQLLKRHAVEACAKVGLTLGTLLTAY